MCTHAQQEKDTFQPLEIYKHDSAQQETTAKFAPPPAPTLKQVVTGHCTLKKGTKEKGSAIAIKPH